MKIYTELKQGTPEWLAVRLGKLTASSAQAIGNDGTGLKTLVYQKAVELMTGKIEENGYKSSDMERGNNLEPMARNAYELQTGKLVRQVGFIELNERVGCSPDGLVEDEGLLEVKCVNDVKFLKFMLESKIEASHIWQMQYQLWVSDRKWVDYALFNPNFKKYLNVVRVLPDAKKFDKIEKGVASGINQIDGIMEMLNSKG